MRQNGRKKGSHFGPVDIIRAYAMSRVHQSGVSYSQIGKMFDISRQQATDTITAFNEYAREHTELLDKLANGTETEKAAAELILRLMFQVRNYGYEITKQKMENAT